MEGWKVTEVTFVTIKQEALLLAPMLTSRSEISYKNHEKEYFESCQQWRAQGCWNNDSCLICGG